MVAVLRAVASVVQGQDEALTLIGCALFSGGHALIEDRPGSGKTTLAKAFAATVGGEFARVQGTADLLPADISGSSIWQGHDVAGGRFVFVPGPLFATVVLVDELNRMPPRTQSAFLEAMDEGAVTVDGARHRLPEPFFLIATQNPAEHHGTYAVPQAQLDRFAVAVQLAPLSGATELGVIRDQLNGPSVERLGTANPDPDSEPRPGAARHPELEQAYDRLEQALARTSLPHAPTETLTELGLRLPRARTGLSVLSRSRYDVQELSPEEQAGAMATMDETTRALGAVTRGAPRHIGVWPRRPRRPGRLRSRPR